MDVPETCFCGCGEHRSKRDAANLEAMMLTYELGLWLMAKAILEAAGQVSGPDVHVTEDGFLVDGASIYRLHYGQAHLGQRMGRKERKLGRRWVKHGQKSRKEIEQQLDPGQPSPYTFPSPEDLPNYPLRIRSWALEGTPIEIDLPSQEETESTTRGSNDEDTEAKRRAEIEAIRREYEGEGEDSAAGFDEGVEGMDINQALIDRILARPEPAPDAGPSPEEHPTSELAGQLVDAACAGMNGDDWGYDEPTALAVIQVAERLSESTEAYNLAFDALTLGYWLREVEQDVTGELLAVDDGWAADVRARKGAASNVDTLVVAAYVISDSLPAPFSAGGDEWQSLVSEALPTLRARGERLLERLIARGDASDAAVTLFPRVAAACVGLGYGLRVVNEALGTTGTQARGSD